jgi:rSAM/selenodomain-associated transferase 2
LKISVIVPMLNEEQGIAATLDAIREGAPASEILVVDGGSTDRSVEIVRSRVESVLGSPPGRALQMNRGAAVADGDVLAFVHADTMVPSTFARDIEVALGDTAIVGGRFDLMLDEPSFACRMLGALISLRSRIMRSATGDQAIFVRRPVFEQLGGFAQIDICEDVEFVRRLKRAGNCACLHAKVVTSARRWRRHGLARTVVRMWLIKSLFLAGISPAWLKRQYADIR